jgi:exodeoxyribonuclease-3
MTWNIKTGGGTRSAAILAVLRRERPHLLALQELRDFDRHDHRRMRELADALGMTAHLAPSVFGQPVAILARPPLTLTRTRVVRWRLHHAAASAVLATDAGPLTVVSTHLNPFSPYRRMREARWLAARYATERRMVLLAGDLNALDPETDHSAALSRLQPMYRRRHLTPQGTVDTRAIAAFRDAGLIDLWRGGPDPGTAPTTEGGGPEFCEMRLDYLLASRPLAERAGPARVIRGDETEYASDHYPVTAELDLTAPGSPAR